MGRVTTVQNSFAEGEYSPTMKGRTDFEGYYAACENLENFFIRHEGGAQFRNGLRFVQNAKSQSAACRLIPFEFSTVQAYVLELSNGACRFYRDQAPVREAAKTITAITQANPAVVTITSHGYSNGDEVYLYDIDGMTELNGRNFIVAGATTHTFQLTGVDSTGYTAYSANGSAERIYELATPWNATEVQEVQFAQSADVLYMVHPSHKPRKITRTAHTSWTIANYAPTADPFTSANNYPSVVTLHEQRIIMGGTNTNPDKLWFSKVGNYEDMTAGTGDADGFSYVPGFGQVNAMKWIASVSDFSVGTAAAELTNRRSSGDEAISVNSIKIRRQSSYGSEYKMPAIIGEASAAFIQGLGKKIRLQEYAFEKDRYTARDVTVKASHIFKKRVGVLAYAKEPFSILLASTTLGQVCAMTFEENERVQGWARSIKTSGIVEAVTVIPGLDYSEIWVQVKRTVNGSTVRYVEFLDFSETYQFHLDSGLTYDGTQSVTLSLSASTGSGVTATAGSSVFTAADVGKQIWYDEPPSGYDISDPPFGYVNNGKKGVATITGYTSGTIVTVDIVRDFDSTSIAEDLWAVAVMSLDGLEHLAGETIGAIINNSEHDDVAVDSLGEISLNEFAAVCHAGIKYQGKLKPMPIIAGGDNGPGVGNTKNTHACLIQFYNTLGGQVGPNEDELEQLPYRDLDDLMDVGPGLFSGWQYVSLPDSDSFEKAPVIIQDLAMPMTVLCAVFKLVGSDG